MGVGEVERQRDLGCVWIACHHTSLTVSAAYMECVHYGSFLPNDLLYFSTLEYFKNTWKVYTKKWKTCMSMLLQCVGSKSQIKELESKRKHWDIADVNFTYCTFLPTNKNSSFFSVVIVNGLFLIVSLRYTTTKISWQ